MKTKWNLARNWSLYVMLIPSVIILIIFSYIPMGGITLAFQNYRLGNGFFESDWVGLKWFRDLFTMPDFRYILRNTVVIACAKIVANLLAAVTFALLLNELKQVLIKRTVQTIVYLPNFLSWVIIGGVFIELLSIGGVVNQFTGLFGIKPILFLGSNDWFQTTMVVIDVWKSFGWGAIIYLAALTNINQELYEAAAIDGANRLRQTWHITLTGIRPTIVLMSALSLGNVLNAGFEQILIMYSPIVYRTGDIIDTFVYRQGLLDLQFSLATAVGLFKSVIGFGLIMLSNYLAKRFADYRIF